MKPVYILLGILNILLSNIAYSQTVNCPGNIIINECDSGLAVFDTMATSGFETIDSISFSFLVGGIVSQEGTGTGSGAMFYADSTQIKITVWDTVGLDYSATCSFYVLVADTTPPVINASNGLAYLDNSGGVKIDTSLFSANISDNCGGIDSVWVVPDTIDCSVASLDVKINAIDSAGNIDSLWVELALQDTIKPTIQVNDTARVYLNEFGFADFDTSDFGIITYDNCSIDSVWLSQDTITCPDSSINQGWAYVMDASGNKDSVEAYVLVKDTIAPVASCKTKTIYLDDAGNALLVSDSVDAGSMDNCWIDSMYLNKWEFGCGDLGTDTVALTVFDHWGLSNTCEAEVVVIDTSNPVVICNDTTIYLNEDGLAFIEIGFVLSTVYDNCAVDTAYIKKHQFTCVDTGANSVFLYAYDSSGNMDSCEAIVTVRDNIKPKISCPYNIIVQANKNTCDTTLNIKAPDVEDNCSNTTISYTLSGATTRSGIGDLIEKFNTGLTNITWMVTDMDGNKTTCVQTVTTYTSLLARNDYITVNEDQGVAILPLSNDLDCDNDIDPSTFTIIDSFSNGTIELDHVNATLTYFTNENYNGYDTLKYKVWDDNGFVDSAKIFMTVVPVNDVPVLANERIEVPEDNTINGTIFLGDDYDEEGDDLIATEILEQGPVHGIFTINMDGDFTYIPDLNYFGFDTVVVEVCDAGIPVGECAYDTVFITVAPVNDIPIVSNDTLILNEDETAGGILLNENDYDPDLTQLKVTTWVFRPEHGALEISADGIYTYVPDANYYGSDMAVLSVCDEDQPISNCGNDTLLITVQPVNDVPIIDNDTISIAEDQTGEGDLTDSGDFDPDGTVLTASSVFILEPSHGEFTVLSDGTYSYVPDSDYYGNDKIVVSVCDSGVPGIACANDTVFVQVTPVNDPPVVEVQIPDFVMGLYETKTVQLNQYFSDIDIDDELSFSATLVDGGDLPGWIRFNESETSLLINPDSLNHIGTTAIKVTASDLDAETVSDEFEITVNMVSSISGRVVLNTGTPPNKSISLSSQAIGDPAQEVKMILKSGTENVDTVYTDSDGYYRFTNMALGTYEIIVSVQFFTQDTTVIITLTEEQPEVGNINFTIWVNNGLITDVLDVENEFNAFVFPNPTKGEVNLKIVNAHKNEIKVTVYNETGLLVLFKELDLEKGVKLDMSEYASGIYYIRINAGTDEVTKKIVLQNR